MKKTSVVAAALMVAVVSGCGSTDSVSAPTTDLSDVITTTTEVDPTDGATSISELSVGDCFVLDDDSEITLDQPVDCETPHDAEVSALLEPRVDEIPDDPGSVFYPMCISAFNEATGTEPGVVTGLLTAYTIDGSKGSEPESDLACLSITRNKESLVGSIAESGPAAVLDGWQPLEDFEPGDCFILGDQTNVGSPSDCVEDTFTYIGSFVVEGDEYPGEDEMRAQRKQGCDALFESSDLEGNPDDVSGTFPDFVTWTYSMSSTITCDVPVVTG